MPAPILSDAQLFAGFDKIAEALGVPPPNTPAQQAFVSIAIKWFFMGARWHQHILEHIESNTSDFQLPGIDFDADNILTAMEKLRNSKK